MEGDSAECDDSEQEEDVLVTFFEKIVDSYFTSDGSVVSLRRFFSRRDEIIEALAYVAHDDPSQDQIPNDLLRDLPPPTLLATLHFLKLFFPRDFYADFLEGFLLLSTDPSAPHFRDTHLLLRLHLADCEREAKHRSASLANFDAASAFYRNNNNTAFHPSVVAFYHLGALNHHEEYASTDAAATTTRIRDDAVKALLGLSDAASAVAAHPSTLFLWVEIKLKLAHLLQWKNGESAHQARTALDAAERAFGEIHPTTAKAVAQLADVLSAPRKIAKMSKSTEGSPERLEDCTEKMIKDRNVAVSLYLREQLIWACLVDELGPDPPLDVRQPLMLSKAKLAYNQACLKDVSTATIVANDACLAARCALDAAMENSRDDSLLARMDVADARDADRTCRKNFLKVIFVRLYLEREKRDAAFDWLLPSLRVVLGETEEAGEGKGDVDERSGALEKRLGVVSLFTRAIVSLASKSPSLEFNPKEMLRKCLTGFPNSPLWKRVYREFLQHDDDEEDRNASLSGVSAVSTTTTSLQVAALNAIFETFLNHSTDASLVVERTAHFVDCWTQLKIFDKGTVERWSSERLDGAQKMIDYEIAHRFGGLSARLEAAYRNVVLKADDGVDLATDLTTMGFRREIIDGLVDRWRRISGLTSPERVFCRSILSERDLLVVSLDSAVDTILLPLLPFLQRVDPSLPELQGVVVTKRVGAFLRAARSSTSSKSVVVRSFPEFATSNLSNDSSPVAKSVLPGNPSVTSLSHDGSSSSSTYLTDAASSVPEFQSASSSAVDVAKMTDYSGRRKSAHVVVALPHELRSFDVSTLKSLRIVLLDDIASMILMEKDDEGAHGERGTKPSNVNDAMDIVKFIAKSQDSQVVAMNFVPDGKYQLDGDSSSFMGTILFQPEVVLLPVESMPFGDLDWDSVRIFRPFVVPTSSRVEKRALLVQLLRTIHFERVLVVAKSLESTRYFRDALETTRQDVGSEDQKGGADAAIETLLHPYYVTSIDEQSSERHRSDELGLFFHDKKRSSVVMVTTEAEVDLESTLCNLVGVGLVVIWVDWSSPYFPTRDLNPDFLRYYVEGSIPNVHFISRDLEENIDAERIELSWLPER